MNRMKKGMTMSQTAEWLRPLRRVLLLWTAAMALAIVFVGVIGGGAAWADEDEEFSLYKTGSSITGYFVKALKPGSNLSISDQWKDLAAQPSTGGGFIGYTDKDKNPLEWLISQATSSSQSISYESLGKLGDGVREYGEFGAALQGAGLDSTASGLDSGLLPMVAGGLVLGAFLLAHGVTVAFNLAVLGLDMLNPFKLMYRGVRDEQPAFSDAIGGGPFDDAIGGGVDPALGPLHGLAEALSDIYVAVSSISWMVLLPVMIMVTIFGMVLSRGSAGGRIHRLIVRVLFIGLGVPVLGGMYTAVLDQLVDETNDGNKVANTVVAQTFVDFEGWVSQYRLAVPEDAVIEWDRSKGKPTGNMIVELQNTVLAINRMVHGDTWGDLSTSLEDFIILDGESDGSSETSAYQTTWSILSRYMNGEKYTSSAYSSAVATELSSNVSGGDNTLSEKAQTWYSELLDVGGRSLFWLDSNDVGDVDPTGNGLLNVSNGLRAEVDGSTVTFTSSSTTQCGVAPKGVSDPCNMSAQGIYNYLNTHFDSTKLTIYSPEKISSAAVARAHNSVSLAGDGFFGKLVNWASAFVVLLSIAMIGLGYAAGMFIGVLRKSLQILTSIPFAMLGAIGSIVKIIAYVVALIMELLVTIFLFEIVQKLLMTLPMILSSVTDELGRVMLGSSAAGLANPVVRQVFMLITIAFMIGFFIMALRLRKSVVRAFTEMATKVVEMVTGYNSPELPGAPATAGLLAGAAGGMASGAGMALAGRLTKGESPKGAGSPGEGPQEVGVGGTADTGGTSGPSPQGGGSGSGSDPEGGLPGGSAIAGQIGVGGTVGSHSDVHLHDDENAKRTGEKVAAEGLTMLPSGSRSGRVAASPEAGPSTSRGGDAIDTMERSARGAWNEQKQTDAARREAITGGAKGLGYAARGVVRAKAGDVGGALSDAQSAVGSVGRTQQAASEARSRAKATAAKDVAAAEPTPPQQSPARRQVVSPNPPSSRPRATPRRKLPVDEADSIR